MNIKAVIICLSMGIISIVALIKNQWTASTIAIVAVIFYPEI